MVMASVDQQLLRDLDLRRELFSDEYTILPLAEQEMLVLIKDNTTAISRGVAILVTDSGIPLASKQGLSPLVKQLTGLGWVTVLVSSPPSDLFQPAEEIMAPTSDTSAPSARGSVSPLNQQVLDKHLQRLSLMMQAVLTKAKEYPGFVLVIAQGTSAASLTQLYTENKLTAPDALVVIDPYWPNRQLNNQLATFLASTPMPVLDIYSKQSNYWSQANIQARKVAAIKALKLHYRQREIIGVELFQQPATYLSKEIYGWLNHMGW